VLYEIIRCFNNILQNFTSYKGIYRKKAVLNKRISANFVLFREINNSFRRASGTFVCFRFRHSFGESFNTKFRVISYFVNFGHFGHFRWRKVILPISQLPNWNWIPWALPYYWNKGNWNYSIRTDNLPCQTSNIEVLIDVLN
jgi:hypothetical protein